MSLKVRSVLSDGSANPDPFETIALKDTDGQVYDPPATVRFRPISSTERVACERKAEDFVKNPRTRGYERRANPDQAATLCLELAIESWDGIFGNDGKPLQVTQATIAALPEHVKAQLLEVVLNTEGQDADAASFREPRDMVRVVGGSGS